MKRYNKISTMLVNAEKYYDPPRDSNSRQRQYSPALHYPSPLQTAISRQPKKKVFVTALI